MTTLLFVLFWCLLESFFHPNVRKMILTNFESVWSKVELDTVKMAMAGATTLSFTTVFEGDIMEAKHIFLSA